MDFGIFQNIAEETIHKAYIECLLFVGTVLSPGDWAGRTHRLLKLKKAQLDKDYPVERPVYKGKKRLESQLLIAPK